MSTMFGTVEELRAAYRALHAPLELGRSACEQDDTAPMLETLDASALDRGGASLMLVAGVCGGAGTTTVALAVAETTAAAALVELTPLPQSGLGAAAATELGTSHGWSTGARAPSGLMLYRNTDHPQSPLPAAVTDLRAVVDLGLWPQGEQLLDRSDHLILVAPCSVPGARRLDATAAEIGSTHEHLNPILVMTGSPSRTLPKPVVACLARPVRDAHERGRLVVFPEHASLRIGGITASPLPNSLQQAAGVLARVLEDCDVA